MKIALTGKLRSGKSAAASHLELYHGFKRISFGGPLKRYADELLEGSDTYPTKYIEYGPPCPFTGEKHTKPSKPRKRYVDFGQAMRKLDPDIWVRFAAKTYEYYSNMKDTRGIVIDDLRQPNEYEWAKANGFIIVRVNSPEHLRIERARAVGDDFDLADLSHETEIYVDSFSVDYEIENNGDIADMERQIDEILAEISEKERAV